jgi:hypothetical protein
MNAQMITTSTISATAKYKGNMAENPTPRYKHSFPSTHIRINAETNLPCVLGSLSLMMSVHHAYLLLTLAISSAKSIHAKKSSVISTVSATLPCFVTNLNFHIEYKPSSSAKYITVTSSLNLMNPSLTLQKYLRSWPHNSYPKSPHKGISRIRASCSH